MATKNQTIELAIIQAVSDNGQMTDVEIRSYLQEQNEDWDDKTIGNMVVKLDRDGKLTRQNTESAWQLTANGRGALDGLRAKMEARYIAPYTDWGDVVAVYTFHTPTLGCITLPGNEGISKFPRLGDDAAAPVLFLGGYILSAMRKAAEKGDATITVGKDGVRRTLPDVAWSRVSVRTITMPTTLQLGRSVRRPTNIRGQAIGEIVHESMPVGTTITIRARFPLSHFSETYLVNLMRQVESTGISSAGTGKGGIWGVGQVNSLRINGREVWPEALENEQPSGQNGRATLTDSLVQSGQMPALTSAVAGVQATATEAPTSSNGHVINGTGSTVAVADDPRSRVTGAIRRAGPAYGRASGGK